MNHSQIVPIVLTSSISLNKAIQLHRVFHSFSNKCDDFHMIRYVCDSQFDGFVTDRVIRPDIARLQPKNLVILHLSMNKTCSHNVTDYVHLDNSLLCSQTSLKDRQPLVFRFTNLLLRRSVHPIHQFISTSSQLIINRIDTQTTSIYR